MSLVQDFVLPDNCSVLSFCDNNTKLCVAFKTEFNLIDMKTSAITELFVAASKLNPLAAISLDNELLLCYNREFRFDSLLVCLFVCFSHFFFFLLCSCPQTWESFGPSPLRKRETMTSTGRASLWEWVPFFFFSFFFFCLFVFVTEKSATN